MNYLVLLPFLALLASAAPNAHANAHNNPLARRHHARQAERVIDALQAPRALAERPKRRVVAKRGATGCRVQGSTATLAVTTTTSLTSTLTSAPTTSVTTSTSAVAVASSSTSDVGVAYNANFKVATPAASSAAATTSTAAAAASSTAATSSSSGSTKSGANSGSLTPNGKKAGVSAGDTLGTLGSHIGWWYNWAPTDEGTSSSSATFVSTLWGGGAADATDSSRLVAFEALATVPQWVVGPEEPDCATGSGSAGMSIGATATLWNSLMAPKGAAGSLLLSPSMCKQMAEDGWLASFQTQITRDFDILNLHINKNSMAGVKADLDYYYNKYNKPIWVTEFACVDDSSSFIPCTDQGQINQFISDIVDLFESDSRVYAYAYSNGYGLGEVWPMWNNGAMTASGQAYLSAISKYH